MERELAPVVMFVYNRLDSVEQTIENLKRNELADQTDLFVFSDAAKKEKQTKDVNLVRKYLYENGYTIVKEDLVKDRHHFYNILKVIPKKDNREFDEIFFDLGYDLFEEGNENFIDFIDYKIRVNKKIIENCKSKNSENAKKAKEKADDYINRLEGVKKDYESKRCNRVY